MKMFRNQSGTKAFSLFTAIIFLNMGFFLAEVSMLKITDRAMLENISNLILTGGLEEEREAHSGGHDAPLKIYSLSSGDQLLLRHAALLLIATRAHHHSQENYRHADHSQKFSPPPDSLVPIS